MRWLFAVIATLTLFAIAIGIGASPAVGREPLQPDATETAKAPPGTPIVDPEPQPRPLFLPSLSRRNDRLLPPPLASVARGYVAALTLRGREACAPATHVLLGQPEGTAGNTVVAALVQGLPHPNLTLDLYVADYVEVKGTDSLTTETCRQVTARLISVRELRVVPRPPGQ